MVNETFCASWYISVASKCLSGLLNVIKVSLSVINGLLSCINSVTCGINLIVNVSSSRFYCLIVVSNFLIDLVGLILVISVNLVQVLIVSSAQVTGLQFFVISSLLASYSSINCFFSSLFSSSVCSDLLIDFCLMVSSCCLQLTCSCLLSLTNSC